MAALRHKRRHSQRGQQPRHCRRLDAHRLRFPWPAGWTQHGRLGRDGRQQHSLHVVPNDLHGPQECRRGQRDAGGRYSVLRGSDGIPTAWQAGNSVGSRWEPDVRRRLAGDRKHCRDRAPRRDDFRCPHRDRVRRPAARSSEFQSWVHGCGRDSADRLPAGD